MATEIGEAREKLGKDIWQMVEDFANNMAHEQEPFYIVYAAKNDRVNPHIIRQTIKAYKQRPPAILGILVWYVDNKEGKFDFVPELSSPPDIPLDPKLLSSKESDSFERVANQGEKMNVLVS